MECGYCWSPTAGRRADPHHYSAVAKPTSHHAALGRGSYGPGAFCADFTGRRHGLCQGQICAVGEDPRPRFFRTGRGRGWGRLAGGWERGRTGGVCSTCPRGLPSLPLPNASGRVGEEKREGGGDPREEGGARREGGGRSQAGCGEVVLPLGRPAAHTRASRCWPVPRMMIPGPRRPASPAAAAPCGHAGCNPPTAGRRAGLWRRLCSNSLHHPGEGRLGLVQLAGMRGGEGGHA